MCTFCYAMVQESQEQCIKTPAPLNLSKISKELVYEVFSGLDGESTFRQRTCRLPQHAHAAGIDVKQTPGSGGDKIEQVLPIWRGGSLSPQAPQTYAKMMLRPRAHQCF